MIGCRGSRRSNSSPRLQVRPILFVLVWILSPAASVLQSQVQAPRQSLPAQWEVDQAVEVLQRFLAAEEAARERSATELARESEQGASPSGLLRALPLRTTSVASEAAAAPTLGDASLNLAGQLHVGADTAIFGYHGNATSLLFWSDTGGNQGFGPSALESNTGLANFNTAVGQAALKKNSDGDHNTAIGFASLFSNTIGTHNTGVGVNSLLSNIDGNYNTGAGVEALYANSTGDSNTAAGVRALYSSTGALNTAAGYRALHANTSLLNTAAGAYALEDNTTGLNNTAIGVRALTANQTGLSNTAVGVDALAASTAGNNTAIGHDALAATTGNRNTAFGADAGELATTGSDNIFVGEFTEGTSSDDGTIRIGGDAGVLGHTHVFLSGVRGITTGNANAIAVVIDSDGQLGTVSSSSRGKQDVHPATAYSRRILDLRPVAFRYRTHVARDPSTPVQFGLIAEDVATVLPELVIFDRGGQPQTVRYQQLPPLLLSALRSAVEDELQSKRMLQRHEKRLIAVEAGLTRLEQANRSHLDEQSVLPVGGEEEIR